MQKSNRHTLKTAYFRAGVIPREEHFAELIDNTLNQEDDGIKKSAKTALQLQAEPEQGVALLLYADFFAPDGQPAQPDWVVKVRTRAEDEGALKSGLDFATAGKSRLFIDQGEGRVGIGTVTPEKLLHVKGDTQIDGKLALQDMEVAGEMGVTGDLNVDKALTVSGLVIAKDELRAEKNIVVLGNLGIRTEAPEKSLHVAGEAKIEEHLSVKSLDATEGVTIQGALKAKELAMTGDATFEGKLTAQSDVLVNGKVQIRPAEGAEVDPAAQLLLVRGAAKIDNKLTVTDLEVTGTTTLDGSLNIPQSLTVGSHVGIGVADPEIHLAVGDKNTGLQQEGGSGSLSLVTLGQPRLYIASNGNVGIHQPSPEQALHVGGSAKIDDTLFVKKLNISEELSIPGALNIPSDLTAEGNIGIGTQNPSIKLAVGDPSTGIHQDQIGTLELRTNNDSRLFIAGNGDTGIGTVQPEEKLHVAGKVKVDGDVKAQNIEAEQVTATSFSGDGSALTNINAASIQGQLGKSQLNLSGDLDVGDANEPYDLNVYGSSLLKGDAILEGKITLKDNLYLRGKPFHNSQPWFKKGETDSKTLTENSYTDIIVPINPNEYHLFVTGVLVGNMDISEKGGGKYLEFRAIASGGNWKIRFHLPVHSIDGNNPPTAKAYWLAINKNLF